MYFSDRKHAGQLLGEKLLKFKDSNTIIVALPRGGVPVGAEIASMLNAPLEVLAVRKIGAPFQQEYAVGALSEDEVPVLSEDVISRLGLEMEDLSDIIKAETNKVRQQIKKFRNNRKLSEMATKTAIVVDDGLATGATMLAAIKFIKKLNPANIIIAVPVAAASSARKLKNLVDDIISCEEREDLMSVGQWYDDFSQVSDEDVLSSLEQINKNLFKKSSHLKIPINNIELGADLVTFPEMKALIIFAHGSGSSRKSPRNQQVAQHLNEAGFGTLLFDLLTESETENRKNVFNIELLSNRLVSATHWIRQQPGLDNTLLGYFGASTGAGAAIAAASKFHEKDSIYAIVSRGGRPDLAGAALSVVKAPTLLIVGEDDVDVITLNKFAQKMLSNSKLSLVAKATHLFEEPGALEEVSRQAAQWFNNHLYKKATKKPIQKSLRLDEATEKEMIPIKNEGDLDRLIHSIKDKRVVMLGESSHGTAEFYQMRSLISKRLIQDHGFKFIAVEGDWPDASRVNKYIRTGHGGNAKNVLKQNNRWPTWMWSNEEIAELSEWMKNKRAEFYGLDIYSLFSSIDEVISYLSKSHPAFALEVKQRYACFDLYKENEISYTRSLLRYPPGCEKEVLINLKKILEIQIKESSSDGEELFSLQQNARVIANAESYYRAMLAADASSWNVRDNHMMETLDLLLEKHGEDAKAIVWAHNTHIGDYRATDMASGGYINLGGLARISYGHENVALVGFGTYQGEVLAGSAWGRPEQIMTLPPAQEESYEFYFHKATQKKNTNQFYLIFEHETQSPFSRRMGHRAVGVVYDPRNERRGNYVPTELSKRYDAFIFIDRTHALKSLHSRFVRGEFPDTWPTGV